MSVETKSTLHDATPSWNGFNYQGKVGIYVCLELIKDAIIQHKINTQELAYFLQQHSIEYEWIEDFSIKNGDNYLSLHQVKHKAGKAFSDHIEAIITILNRNQKILSPVDLNKYIDISLEAGEILKDVLQQVLRSMSDAGYLNDEYKLAHNWSDITTEIERIEHDKLMTCLSEFESFSTNAFDTSLVYFHTAESVSLPNKDIDTYSDVPSKHKDTLKGLKTLTSLDIYLGCDEVETYDLVLSDTALINKIESLISELLLLIHGHSANFSPSDKQIYIAGLLKLVDTHILERHHKIRSKTNLGSGFNELRSSINFQEFYQVLASNFRNQNEEYWDLFCRNNFEKAYSEYINTCNRNIELERNAVVYQRALDNVKKYREMVLSPYLTNNIVELMKIISPHIPHEGSDQDFYVAISSTHKIKDVFLRFIEGIATIDYTLYFRCQDSNQYQPSCIDLRGDDEWQRIDNLENFKNSILKNEQHNKILFKDSNYLVVNASPEHSIDYESVHLETITEGVIPEDIEKNNHHITTPHHVALMHYTTAIKVLSNE